MSVEKLYLEAGRKLSGSQESQMFGRPCFKINGKAFMSLFDDAVVFKLEGKEHESALQLKGAVRFDPSRKGRALKEWVEVPSTHKLKFSKLAAQAIKYVKRLTK